MSDNYKSWNNVSKRKKRRPSNKKDDNSSSRRRGSSRSWKGSTSTYSKNDFPSLTENKFSTFNKPYQVNTYNALVWRKNSESSNDSNTIYNKAKSGATTFNSYPFLVDSPEFPLFQ